MKENPNREETRNIYTDKFFEYSNDDIKKHLHNVLDNAYCIGYNTVLDACWNVLSKEDYKKVTDWLDKNGY